MKFMTAFLALAMTSSAYAGLNCAVQQETRTRPVASPVRYVDCLTTTINGTAYAYSSKCGLWLSVEQYEDSEFKVSLSKVPNGLSEAAAEEALFVNDASFSYPKGDLPQKFKLRIADISNTDQSKQVEFVATCEKN